MALPTYRVLFKFFTSLLVPSGSPGWWIDTLASTRIEPSDIEYTNAQVHLSLNLRYMLCADSNLHKNVVLLKCGIFMFTVDVCVYLKVLVKRDMEVTEVEGDTMDGGVSRWMKILAATLNT